MRLHHIALTIFITIIWGFNFVVIDLGLKEVSPHILCFLRFFLACFPAILFVKRPKVSLPFILTFSLIMFVLHFTFLFMGMNIGMTPGLASLLMQTQIFFTVLLAVIFLGEEVNKYQIMGGLVACSGIVLVGTNLGSTSSLLGFILTIAAACSWGVGNFLSKSAGRINMFSLITWSSLIAWPPLFLISLYVDGIDKMISCFSHLSGMSLFAIFYIVYPSTLFGFAGWNWLLSKYPTATITPFTLLVPIFGLIGSCLFLGESLQSWKVLAASLVITGLCISLLVPKLMAKFSMMKEHKACNESTAA